MKQSVIVQPRQSIVEERPIPPVGAEDVLVRVRACGVCASELHGWQGGGGPYPREFGHEVVGEVVETGSQVCQFKPGMRVTGLFYKGFAEYACAQQSLVVEIPAGVEYEAALGEPLACILSGARRTHVELGDTVVLVGLGYMGLLMLQAARLRGPARIIAVDPRPEAREAALRFGADETYAPEAVPARLKMTQWSQIGQGYGANVVFESSGTQGGLALAGQMVREHGVLSLVGWHQGGPRQVDVELWNWKAFDVINAHERRMDYLVDCMRRGLALVAAGKLDPTGLVTHRFSIDEVDMAFQALVDKPDGFVKAVIAFPEG